MSYSEKQLLLLDNLIYTELVLSNEGKSLESILSLYTDDKGNVDPKKLSKKMLGGGMFTKDAAEIMTEILKDDKLRNLRIDKTVDRGIKAACFVDRNGENAVVAFRGTEADWKQWYLNFEGFGNVRTDEHKKAEEFFNQLNYENITVTGHSKGGNIAMYLTIVCPEKVERCLSFEGQGFSKEFCDKYEDEIKKNKDKIKNICGSSDVVSPLLMSVAGETVYVKSDSFIISGINHGITGIWRMNKDNFDENGNIQDGAYVEQGMLMKWLGELTVYLAYLSEVPLLGDTLEFFTDFFGVVIGIYQGKDNIKWEDFFEITAALIQSFVEYKINTHPGVVVIKYLYNVVCKWYESVKEYHYSNLADKLSLNTDRMREYAQRLHNVNKRIGGIDKRLNSLYTEVEWSDLWDLMQADSATDSSWRLSRCQNYLEETAEDFEGVEISLLKR